MEASVKQFCIVYDLNRAKNYGRLERYLQSIGARRGKTTTTWYTWSGPLETVDSLKAELRQYVDGDDDLEVIECAAATDPASRPVSSFDTIAERMALADLEHSLGGVAFRRPRIGDDLRSRVIEEAVRPRRRSRLAIEADSVSLLASALDDLDLK
jgi:hypothetical protein